MVEEPSESLKIGVVTQFVASSAGVAIGMLLLLLLIFNNMSSKVTQIYSSVGVSSMLDLTTKTSVPAPIVYSALETATDNIDTITLVNLDKSEVVIYKFGSLTLQNSIILLSGEYSKNNLKVNITDSQSGNLYNVRLEVID